MTNSKIDAHSPAQFDIHFAYSSSHSPQPLKTKKNVQKAIAIQKPLVNIFELNPDEYRINSV